MARRRKTALDRHATDSVAVRNAHTLVRIASAIARVDATSIDAELDRSLERIGSALGVDIVSITSVGEDGRLEAWMQWRGIGWVDPAFAIDTPATDWWDSRQRRNEEIVIDDVAALPDEADYERALLSERGTRSLTAIPITSLSELYGYVVVEHLRRRHAWTDEELTFLGNYAELVSSTLERKATQLDLQASAVRAEAANRAKTEFVANLSHELRTPLTAILGYAEIMSKTGDTKYIDEIDKSAQHLRDIVQDALDIASIDAGRMMLAVHELSLESTIESAIAQVEMRARRAGVSIRVAVDDDTPTVFADGRKLRQILINLLVNAVKFNREDGSITVRVSADDHSYAIEVEDTGVGIASRDFERIFESFIYVDAETDGVGLGLALVRRFAEAHGGTVTVASEVGIGSTFRVELPRDARQFVNNRPAYLGGLT